MHTHTNIRTQGSISTPASVVYGPFPPRKRWSQPLPVMMGGRSLALVAFSSRAGGSYGECGRWKET